MKIFICLIIVASFLMFSFGLSAEDEALPKRIISLGPAITEQLYLLGVKERVVGVTSYCRHSQEKEIIGTVIDVDIEKVVELTPDLVVATPLTNPKTIKKLKNLGIPLEEFSLANDFDQLCRQFIALGEILGEKMRAKEIVQSAKKEVQRIKESVKDKPEVSVLVQVGANPLFVATKESFINDSIELAGGINVVSGTKTGLYSRERVLTDNPDVIIIITMGLAGAEQKELWKSYPTLNAVKNSRIHVVDDYLHASPTPITFLMALKQMRAFLHPGITFDEYKNDEENR